MILHTVGSNLLLYDKNLLIEAKKPFHIIEKALNAKKPEINRLEPPRKSLDELKAEVFDAQIPVLLPIVDDVRTFFLEHQDYEIPVLANIAPPLTKTDLVVLN